ncbi:MAG: L(+)-tartrate dehydratase subunit alpha [Ottowia sp.]|jgi:L(+)-tartrate dehydratase alpha subunit|uniref:L(+)-tartrate dehydratase subunit alpha n=1 Tax=Ottowia sp. TaxID=1898956 RepID=UPI0011D3C059|nr:L(+)-tartrate dehydratase subunit alpha [Ottowia sp.]MBP6665875.1 L(+)-tartrate dehydratase subunit alpha [Ottowia sp.]MBP7459451.1 L(+)-tartrate dehydratase subunit alpha [Ottowia sp.]MBP8161230.1 L(+)-tartrate dehydratase subunit alpha [Ottowia sp.]MBP8861883.1 L(+)-tartrate dehydratase subunit alpha [Ottowia sp.]MBP8896418.1 L(+)-tartrate dehydratase subunit alpha [Ottowia sp.]
MNREQAVADLTNVMSKFTAYIGKRLPTDVTQKLGDLREKEVNFLAKEVYESMRQNQEAADKLDRPSCQDTGVIQYFLTAGANFPLLGELEEILQEATAGATREGPLRHNAVETFVEKNTGTNTGSKIPWLDWDIVPGDDSVTIDVYMAGGGCTLPGKATVLMPGQGYEGVAEFVFDVITSRGVNACPPLLVGVGVSTSAETAARLSKKAILRPVDSRHPNDNAALMEQLLTDGLNELGLGPQGLTGNNSVMGVNIESSARHPSTIGVAVSTGCWAHRRGRIRINADMSYEVISHQGFKL